MIRDVKLYREVGKKTDGILIKLIDDRGNAYLSHNTCENFREVASQFAVMRENITGLEPDDFFEFDSFIKTISSNFIKISPSLGMALSVAFARAYTENRLYELLGPRKRVKLPNILVKIYEGGGMRIYLINKNHEGIYEFMHEVKNFQNSLKNKDLSTGKMVEHARESGFLVGVEAEELEKAANEGFTYVSNGKDLKINNTKGLLLKLRRYGCIGDLVKDMKSTGACIVFDALDRVQDTWEAELSVAMEPAFFKTGLDETSLMKINKLIEISSDAVISEFKVVPCL